MTRYNQNIGDETPYGPHKRGDDLVIEILVKDQDGNVKDLTGASAAKWIMVRGSTSITKTLGSGVTIPDAVNGMMQIDVAAAETALLEAGQYHHELEITDASGKVHTVTVGKVEVVADRA